MTNSIKKYQQSSSGWGGKRKGAGAPVGNFNAIKHGKRSRQLFFPLYHQNGQPPDCSQLVLCRMRNLVALERIMELKLSNSDSATQRREVIFLEEVLYAGVGRIEQLEVRALQTKIGMKTWKQLYDQMSYWNGSRRKRPLRKPKDSE
ncbi:MAG: hypothetical protein ACK5M5_08490 [Limnobaculum xujianqingii]